MRKWEREIAREAGRFGGKVERTGSGHFQVVLPNGRFIMTGSTPGRAALSILRRQLRSAQAGNARLK